MSRPVNIAILSTAHIHTKGFLENIRKTDDGRTAYAIWDDNAERGRRYAAEFGATFVPDLKRVLADDAVDGFLICAENTRHLPLLKQVMALGKPVFCEKPLVTTVPELKQVQKLIAKYPKTILFCGYFQPFGGQMVAIKEMIRSGALGKITHVRFRNAHHAAYGHWFDNPDLQWFVKPKLSGGGALMDMGAHAVHLLAHLCGPAKKVSAVIANRSGIYKAVDDHGIAQIEFASGVLGTVEAAWIHQGGPGGLEVHGSEGAVWHQGGTYVTGKPGQDAKPVEAAAEKPKTVDRLVAAIRGEIGVGELAEDLVACQQAVAMMAAAYASNRSGKWQATAPVKAAKVAKAAKGKAKAAKAAKAKTKTKAGKVAKSPKKAVKKAAAKKSAAKKKAQARGR
jgi:predicted dehydrogenase